MCVKLLTEHHFEFLSLKEAAQVHLSLHMSKNHIVGNHIAWLMFCLCILAGVRMKYPSCYILLVDPAPMTPHTAHEDALHHPGRHTQ